MLHLPPSGGVHVQSGWCKAREEGGVHQRNGGITTMLIPRSPGLPRGMGPPCPRRGSPSCEIRVVLTRVFSRPKISAWVPLGRRGEYGGVTYVSVSGCPFRWITPLFYPCLQMPGYPPYGVMLPDIREGWAGGIKYDGGSGGDPPRPLSRGPCFLRLGSRDPARGRWVAGGTRGRWISGSCPGTSREAPGISKRTRPVDPAAG